MHKQLEQIQKTCLSSSRSASHFVFQIIISCSWCIKGMFASRGLNVPTLEDLVKIRQFNVTKKMQLLLKMVYNTADHKENQKIACFLNYRVLSVDTRGRTDRFFRVRSDSMDCDGHDVHSEHCGPSTRWGGAAFSALAQRLACAVLSGGQHELQRAQQTLRLQLWRLQTYSKGVFKLYVLEQYVQRHVIKLDGYKLLCFSPACCF